MTEDQSAMSFAFKLLSGAVVRQDEAEFYNVFEQNFVEDQALRNRCYRHAKYIAEKLGLKVKFGKCHDVTGNAEMTYTITAVLEK